MSYFKKISTKENLHLQSSGFLTLVKESDVSAFVARTGQRSPKVQEMYDKMKQDNPTDFEDITESDWTTLKSTILGDLTDYAAPSTAYYKNPLTDFVYCWNEEENKASVLSSTDQQTIAFMIYTDAHATTEIENRLKEVSTYTAITESDWLARKAAVLEIIQGF